MGSQKIMVLGKLPCKLTMELSHVLEQWFLHLLLSKFKDKNTMDSCQAHFVFLCSGDSEWYCKDIFIRKPCITFLSPLRGSPSSTVAPRVTPQSYFLL
jgi:hypothetical protein